MSGRWFRDIYRDAVWESEELTAAEKAVAETYARHARDEHDDKSATADLAWTTYPRLMAKAGIGRRANVSTAVASLVEKGWLTVVREVSRRPTLYRLTIPDGSSTLGTTEVEGSSSTPGTTVVPPSQSGSSTSGAGSSDGGTQPLGPLENQPSTSSLSARTSVPGPRDPADDRERDESTTSEDQNHDQRHRWVIEAGSPPHLAAEVVDYLEAKHGVRGIGWWKTVRKEGDLPALVSEAVFVNTPTAVTADDTACHTCGDTGKVETRSMYEGDALKINPCHHCTNDGRGNCRIHPGYRSRRCAGCRGDRIAVQDHQGSSSQRGRPEPVNAEARKAQGWLNLPTHQPYSNPPPEAYDDWLDLPTPQAQPAIEASPTL